MRDTASRGIGVIGYGAIGRELCSRLAVDAARYVPVVLMRRASSHADVPGLTVVRDLDALIAARPALVVEAAGHEAVRAYAPQLLDRGISVMITSVGVLADDAFHDRLTQAAAASGAKLLIPSGALGGLDYARLLKFARDASVVYTSRKPIAAWRKELTDLGVDPASLCGEYVLYEGTAREAARRYPKSLNAALGLAIAGIGVERTHVRVVADAAVSRNTHEVAIASEFGTAHLVFENFASPDNPKTSMLVVPSLMVGIEAYFDSGAV